MTSASGWRESAVLFDCEGETLVGVVAAPAVATAATDVGVVIIVGGPQYRAGSHRMFVRLARSLAAAGCPALRFDVRGMGDSTGETQGFEHQAADIAAAVAALKAAQTGVRRVVLWGLCDGASSALMYLQERRDPHVHGVCLVNPWVRTEALQARTQIRHYYLQRLMQPAFWKKLITGGVGVGALGDLRASVQRAGGGADGTQDYVERMRQGLLKQAGPVLLVQSGNDYTAREFDELLRTDTGWQAAMRPLRVTRHDVDGADHTFSNDGAMMQLERCTVDWTTRILGRADASAGSATKETA